MRWIVPSIALALAPLASSCASLPGYGAWVISDFCNSGGDDRPWVRTEAPANADAYRTVAATDQSGMEAVPEGAREYWFALPSGAVKLCRTNLKRAEYGRTHWCNPPLAVWWSFRETEGGPVIENSQLPICLT
jgi:hypothetical protein